MICRYITASSIGLLLALPALAAPVDTGELARCHAMPTRDERLDCYEALATAAQSAAGPTASSVPHAGGPPATTAPGAPTASVAPPAAGQPLPASATSASSPGTPASAAQTASSVSPAAAPGAPGTSTSSAAAQSSPGAVSPPLSASSAVAFDPDDPANFGLNRRQVEPHSGGPSSVKSTVYQMTEDRLHNISVVLENGQTWAFIEPDPRLRPGDSVTIKHASLGSFLMLTPSRRSYRVERVK